MTRFHGPAFKGAMKCIRAIKRTEAERRNAATVPERRSRKGAGKQAQS